MAASPRMLLVNKPVKERVDTFGFTTPPFWNGCDPAPVMSLKNIELDEIRGVWVVCTCDPQMLLKFIVVASTGACNRCCVTPLVPSNGCCVTCASSILAISAASCPSLERFLPLLLRFSLSLFFLSFFFFFDFFFLSPFALESPDRFSTCPLGVNCLLIVEFQ